MFNPHPLFMIKQWCRNPSWREVQYESAVYRLEIGSIIYSDQYFSKYCSHSLGRLSQEQKNKTLLVVFTFRKKKKIECGVFNPRYMFRYTVMYTLYRGIGKKGKTRLDSFIFSNRYILVRSRWIWGLSQEHWTHKWGQFSIVSPPSVVFLDSVHGDWYPFVSSIPGRGCRSTTALTRINRLLKTNEFESESNHGLG